MYATIVWWIKFFITNFSLTLLLLENASCHFSSKRMCCATCTLCNDNTIISSSLIRHLHCSIIARVAVDMDFNIHIHGYGCYKSQTVTESLYSATSSFSTSTSSSYPSAMSSSMQLLLTDRNPQTFHPLSVCFRTGCRPTFHYLRQHSQPVWLTDWKTFVQRSKIN